MVPKHILELTRLLLCIGFREYSDRIKTFSEGIRQDFKKVS
jgi:hypothetical protein